MVIHLEDASVQCTALDPAGKKNRTDRLHWEQWWDRIGLYAEHFLQNRTVSFFAAAAAVARIVSATTSPSVLAATSTLSSTATSTLSSTPTSTGWTVGGGIHPAGTYPGLVVAAR